MADEHQCRCVVGEVEATGGFAKHAFFVGWAMYAAPNRSVETERRGLELHAEPLVQLFQVAPTDSLAIEEFERLCLY